MDEPNHHESAPTIATELGAKHTPQDKDSATADFKYFLHVNADIWSELQSGPIKWSEFASFLNTCAVKKKSRTKGQEWIKGLINSISAQIIRIPELRALSLEDLQLEFAGVPAKERHAYDVVTICEQHSKRVFTAVASLEGGNGMTVSPNQLSIAFSRRISRQ